MEILYFFVVGFFLSLPLLRTDVFEPLRILPRSLASFAPSSLSFVFEEVDRGGGGGRETLCSSGGTRGQARDANARHVVDFSKFWQKPTTSL